MSRVIKRLTTAWGDASLMMDLVTAATAADEKQREAAVALLPIGSFEQHVDFLPLITDTVVASAIARNISRAYPTLLLPPITISCSHEHASWRGTVSSRTLYQIVADVAVSLTRSGVEHLVHINGHGGNYRSVLCAMVKPFMAAGRRFPQSR
ncbi:creatininase family protein [Micromonospora sp. IBHARD004]|uniref:creatininase family protein n=1 Tax=Micromonospora sp. IBHARD004 TaxID=3457764 RepID=UPI00405A311C